MEIWFLDSTGLFTKKECDIGLCPKLDRGKYRSSSPQTSLWKLVGLEQPLPDPQSYKETIDFLQLHGKKETAQILY